MTASPDLWAMTPRAQEIALEWYEAGYVAGVAEGRRREDAELGALHRLGVATARQAAQGEPYDVLAERRGEPERAAVHRALLAERGI